MTMPYVRKRSRLFLFVLPLAFALVACESEFYWEPPVPVEHTPVSLRVQLGDSVIATGDASSMTGTIELDFLQTLMPLRVVFLDAAGEEIVPSSVEYMAYENADREIARFDAAGPGEFFGEIAGRGIGTTSVTFMFMNGPIGAGESRLTSAPVNVVVSAVPTPDPQLYIDDFEANDFGVMPAGWTEFWTVGNQWVNVVQLNGHKVMRHYHISSSIRFIRFDAPGRVMNVELIGRTRIATGGTGTQAGIRTRTFGDASMETCYQWEFRQVSAQNIVRMTLYNSGGLFTAASFDYDWEYDTWYWLRFKVDGYYLYGKVWRDDEDEPDDWTVAVSDPRVVLAGPVGVGNWQNNGYRYWDYIAAGTYGHPVELPVGYDLGPEIDPFTVTIDPETVWLSPGETIQLTATAVDVATQDTLPDMPWVWLSRDEEMATVSQTGLLTAHSLGSEWVMAEAEGQRAWRQIQVANPTLTGLATVPFPKIANQPLTFTLTGTGFNPNTVQVRFYGAGCPTAGCLVSNANLVVKTPTQLVGTTTLGAGSYDVRVRNGTAGVLSNALTFF